MKQSIELKKQLKHLGEKTFYTLLLILVAIIASYIPINVNSATVDEIKYKIEQTSSSRSEIEKEIEKYQLQLKSIGDQANSLQNTIKTLEATSKKMSADIKLTEKNIELTQLEISSLDIEINKKKSSIEINSAAISNSLQEINEFEDSSFIEVLLGSDSISEFFSDIQTLSQFNDDVALMLDDNRQAKKNYEENKLTAQKKQLELKKLKTELADKKFILDSNKKEQSKLLANTKNQESNYKKLLAAQEAKRQALERELAQYESELSFAIDKKILPKSGSGVLSWPLDKVYITQLFGLTDFAKSGAYGGKGHNGVDFRASIGTTVKTVLSGVVEGTGDTDIVCPGASWGKWVLVKHNNGLSTIYGHLSLIKVAAGQYVSTGDTIGYSGNSGYSTGPHLHLTVYASQGVKVTTLKSTACKGTYTIPIASPNAYLDPMLYL